jgi:hypothetical protein
MRTIPFHALRFDAATAVPRALAHPLQTLDEPVLRIVPLYDAIDVAYAYDLELTSGVVVCLVVLACLRLVVAAVKRSSS